MAKVLYGGGVTEVKGRIAGTSFQRTQYGPQANVVRVPVTRHTFRQGQIRSAFVAAVTRWRDLAPDARQAWNESAPGKWSGFNYFVSVNAADVASGGNPSDYPPGFNYFSVLSFVRVTFGYWFSKGLKDFNIYFNSTRNLAGQGLIWHAGITAPKDINTFPPFSQTNQIVQSGVTPSGKSWRRNQGFGLGNPNFQHFPGSIQAYYLYAYDPTNSFRVTNILDASFRTQPYADFLNVSIQVSKVPATSKASIVITASLDKSAPSGSISFYYSMGSQPGGLPIGKTVRPTLSKTSTVSKSNGGKTLTTTGTIELTPGAGDTVGWIWGYFSHSTKELCFTARAYKEFYLP